MFANALAKCAAVLAIAAGSVATTAHAADFDWKKFQGKTISFLANNNPVSQALLTHKAEFEKLTGMTLKVDSYQEQQMRQRLVTVMNAHSDEVDVFMTLPSREGEQFAATGWYGDLTAASKNQVAGDYDYAGLSQALLKAGTFGGKLTSVPMNIEGPILYYRTDIFKKCGVEKPATIGDLEFRRREAEGLRQQHYPVRVARTEAGRRLYVQQHAAQYRRQLHRQRQIESLLGKGQGGARHLWPPAARFRPARRGQL